VSRLLDRAALWWLDRHCRAWCADLTSTSPAPVCHVRVYGTTTDDRYVMHLQEPVAMTVFRIIAVAGVSGVILAIVLVSR